MMSRFLGAWIFYWAMIALLPVSSIYPATNEALLLQMVFVFLVATTLVVMIAESGVPREPRAGFGVPDALQLIWVAIALSTIGLMALAYDKVLIQEVDFSQGLAAARRQWGELAAVRGGRPSSIFSIVGYFLGSTHYVATALAVTQTRAASFRHRSAALAACLLLVLANSALTGGRSGLLLWGVFVIGAWGVRQTSAQDIRASTLRRTWIALAFVVALGYILLIFYQRADLSNTQSIDYALEFLPFLGLNAAPWYVEWIDGASYGGLSAMLVLAGSYISHSFATVAAIVDAPPEDKAILFVHVLDMMHKLGLAPRLEGDWFLDGRFPSVPGALWHQFGPSGFVAGSLLIGAVCALAKIWHVQRSTKLMPLGIYVAAEATLILTPAIFAPDILAFPFALVGLAILAFIHYFLCWLRSQSHVSAGCEGRVVPARDDPHHSA